MSEKPKNVISIDGKEYDIDEMPTELRNIIVARQEIQNSKIRHEIELEKIELQMLSRASFATIVTNISPEIPAPSPLVLLNFSTRDTLLSS